MLSGRVATLARAWGIPHSGECGYGERGDSSIFTQRVHSMAIKQLNVFSTCPQSKDVPASEYLDQVAEVARWSEIAGCKGILIYADNGLVDPWIVSHVVFRHTMDLCPLVAIQPVYMHPYAAAKIVSSYAYLYGRQMYLNMIAGGFKNDLVALNDNTPHDDRYKRLTEYTVIMRQLLESPNPVTFEGQYYSVRNLKMNPPLPADLMPGILMSGSSEAGLQAARDSGATAIRYPQRPDQEAQLPRDPSLPSGVRVGIIARGTTEEAWAVATERFPADKKGHLLHQLAMKTSDSQWHKQLSEMSRADSTDPDDPYWLGPFENYKTFCPYLVGSYERVATEISRYVAVGYETFILDIPPSIEELQHTKLVFEEAVNLANLQPSFDR